MQNPVRHNTMSETQTPISSPPQSPVEIIAGNEDLLTEILKHLPVKPLLRFKSVSKQWLSLISHPRFSLLHTLRHAHPPSSALFFLRRHHHHSDSTTSTFDFIPLLATTSTHPPPFFSLLKSSPIDILQSCNGLLLCSPTRIYNPTTNQVHSIVLPPHIVHSGLGLNLAFDPSRSVNFEVVCLLKVEEDAYAIEVYSSATRQWRRPGIDPFPAPFDVEFDRGVYHDGMIIWLSHTDNTFLFDLDNERVETLRLPKAMEGAYIERFRYLGESCGNLHLIEIRTNCLTEFDVLELDRNREWYVKYRVNLDVVGCGFENLMFQDHSDRFGRRLRFYAFSVLAVVRRNKNNTENAEKDDDDDSSLIVSVPGKVISYNFRAEVSRLLCNVVDESDKWLPFKGYNAFQFIESLYPI